ncbi:MAG: STAS-like domain-containing protein [Bacteroidota bacterium]
MKTIKVVSLVGNPCLLSPDKGTSLYQSINDGLQEASPVVVDFAGYEFLSSTFLNHSFGQLCIDNDWDDTAFKEKVSIVGMEEDDVDEVAITVHNAQLRRTLKLQHISPAEYYSQRLPA